MWQLLRIVNVSASAHTGRTGSAIIITQRLQLIKKKYILRGKRDHQTKGNRTIKNNKHLIFLFLDQRNKMNVKKATLRYAFEQWFWFFFSYLCQYKCAMHFLKKSCRKILESNIINIQMIFTPQLNSFSNHSI